MQRADRLMNLQFVMMLGAIAADDRDRPSQLGEHSSLAILLRSVCCGSAS